MLLPDFRLPHFPEVVGLDFLSGELVLNKNVYCGAKDLIFAKTPIGFREKNMGLISNKIKS